MIQYHISSSVNLDLTNLQLRFLGTDSYSEVLTYYGNSGSTLLKRHLKHLSLRSSNIRLFKMKIAAVQNVVEMGWISRISRSIVTKSHQINRQTELCYISNFTNCESVRSDLI